MKPRAVLFLAVIAASALSAGCASAGRAGKAEVSPVDRIPEYYSLFIRADRSVLRLGLFERMAESLSDEYGIPDYFIRNTETLSHAVLPGGWNYTAVQGSYPDSLIINRMRGDSEWTEISSSGYKCFFSAVKSLAVIAPGRNSLVVFRADESSLTERTGQIVRLIDGAGSGIVEQSEKTVFLYKSRSNASGVAEILPESYDSSAITETAAELKASAGGLFSLEMVFYLGDEKLALLLSSVLRISVSQYLRRHDIADFRLMREKNMVYREGKTVRVDLKDMPSDKMDMLIEDIIYRKE